MEARTKLCRLNRRLSEAFQPVEALEPRRLLAGFSVIQLTSLPTGAGDLGPSHLTASGPNLFFEASSATTNQLAAYVSDGTAAGTTELALPAGASGAVSGLFAATGASTTAAPLVYFTAGASVYRTDGTAAGTTAVALPSAAGATASGTTTTAVGTLNSDVILYVSNGTTATLWSSDGTAADSVELGPAPPGLTPGQQSATAGGYCYFSLGGDLYATNGTAGASAAQAFTGANQLYNLTAVGNQLFFAASGGALGGSQTLEVVSSFGAGPLTLFTGTFVNNLVDLNGSLLYAAVDSSGNASVSLSNGTISGTVQLIGGISDVQDVNVIGNEAFFVAEQSGALNLYTTTGTGGGTTAVRALGAPASFTYASGTVALAGQAAFVAPESGSTAALWTSFGITATTNPQLANTPAGTLAVSTGGLIFDATPAPATAAAAVVANGAASGVGQLYVLNGTGTGIGSGTGGGGTGAGGGGVTSGGTLTAAVTADTLPAVFVPGDSGVARITITNTGAAAVSGRLAVQLYLSPDGTVADGVALSAPALARVAVALGVGRAKTVAAKFTVPASVAAGTEELIAVLSPLSGFADGDVSSTPAVSSTAATAALSFGAVGARSRVRLVAESSASTPIIYQLLGPGTGTLTPQSDGNDVLTLTGTTAASSVVIAVAGRATETLDGIVSSGPIAQLLAPKVNLAGNLTVSGDVRRVVLDDVSNAAISFSGTVATSVSLGTVASSSLASTDPLSVLVVSSWATGTIGAPSIGTLLDNGDLTADVAAAGNIGAVVVRGLVSDSDILAGANFGAAGVPGGGDDTFAVGTIRIVEVLGSVSADSTIAAGLSATDDIFPPDGDDTLLTGGRIGDVVIRGQLEPGSLVLAAVLPRRASVAGHAVTTSGAAGFVLP